MAKSKSKATSASDIQKLTISRQFETLIDTLKTQLSPLPEPQQFNHCVDIFSKWNRNYFYLMQKYKTGTNATVDFFEIGLARLEYRGTNKFSLAYFRHTGQWFTIFEDLSLEDCQTTILNEGVFDVS